MNTKGRSIKETKKAMNEEVGPFTLFLVTLGADLINALQREGRLGISFLLLVHIFLSPGIPTGGIGIHIIHLAI